MRFSLVAGTIAALLAFPSYSQSTDSAERSDTITMKGRIEAVDAETRQVTITGEDGESTVFEAGDNVANFDQIEVGDQVTLEYAGGVALAMADPADDGAPEMVISEARAALGDKPGAATVEIVTFVVEVVSYDSENQMATVIFPEGDERTLPVDDRMVEFAKSRQPGDRVLVVVGQSVAVAVTPSE
ncbi:hypothetical protein R5H32_08755 [Defluviimonas sp. D31]|uniref:hypothetical protein n=1 Tax=Defluviimonas sp. D31 TaxID=3083253 RepID=UPI00296FAFF8|nr:hypothetical protein [Defluviimonas sp. D31]MDW4549439.1 hypothetical protein [Defluviimonas sp. D31]